MMSPLNAKVFADIFQDKETSGQAMKEFLNAILEYLKEDPITEIADMVSGNPVMEKGAYERYGSMEVMVKADTNRYFDITVQVGKEYLDKMSLVLASRLYSDNYPQDNAYCPGPTVRVINLINYLIQDEYPYTMRSMSLYSDLDEPERLTDKMRMIHIQLPGFRKECESFEAAKKISLFTWLYLFDHGYKNPEETKVLSTMSEGLKNFIERYYTITKNITQ